MGIESALAAVRALSRGTPSQTDWDRYIVETNDEKNDRGAAILLATNLENALQYAIIAKLQIPADRHDEMVMRESAPLSAFSNKIIVAHSIRIFGEHTRRNLDIVRTIRNAFAHARIPIRFDTPAIAGACALMRPPPLLYSRGLSPVIEEEAFLALSPKQKFQNVCETTTHNLIRSSLPEGGFVHDARRKRELMADILKSLP